MEEEQIKEVAAELRKIYTAATAAEAEQALVEFADRWDNLYPIDISEK